MPGGGGLERLADGAGQMPPDASLLKLAFSEPEMPNLEPAYGSLMDSVREGYADDRLTSMTEELIDKYSPYKGIWLARTIDSEISEDEPERYRETLTLLLDDEVFDRYRALATDERFQGNSEGNALVEIMFNSAFYIADKSAMLETLDRIKDKGPGVLGDVQELLEENEDDPEGYKIELEEF